MKERICFLLTLSCILLCACKNRSQLDIDSDQVKGNLELFASACDSYFIENDAEDVQSNEIFDKYVSSSSFSEPILSALRGTKVKRDFNMIKISTPEDYILIKNGFKDYQVYRVVEVE